MGVDLRNTPGTLVRKRRTTKAEPWAVSAPQGPGSRALVPRQVSAAGQGQLGLVYQVVGAGASCDSERGELVQAGTWGQSNQPAYKFAPGPGYLGQTG